MRAGVSAVTLGEVRITKRKVGVTKREFAVAKGADRNRIRAMRTLFAPDRTQSGAVVTPISLFRVPAGKIRVRFSLARVTTREV
jgi:hypothetical protein